MNTSVSNMGTTAGISSSATYYELANYLAANGYWAAVGDDCVRFWINEPTNGFIISNVSDWSKSAPADLIVEVWGAVSQLSVSPIDSVDPAAGYSALVKAKREESRIPAIEFVELMKPIPEFDLKYLWMLENGYLVEHPSIACVSAMISALGARDTDFAAALHEACKDARGAYDNFVVQTLYQGRTVNPDPEVEAWLRLKIDISRLIWPDGMGRWYSSQIADLCVGTVNPKVISTLITPDKEAVDISLKTYINSYKLDDLLDAIALINPEIDREVLGAKIQDSHNRYQAMYDRQHPGEGKAVNENSGLSEWLGVKKQLCRLLWEAEDIPKKLDILLKGKGMSNGWFSQDLGKILSPNCKTITGWPKDRDGTKLDSLKEALKSLCPSADHDAVGALVDQSYKMGADLYAAQYQSRQGVWEAQFALKNSTCTNCV